MITNIRWQTWPPLHYPIHLSQPAGRATPLWLERSFEIWQNNFGWLPKKWKSNSTLIRNKFWDLCIFIVASHLDATSLWTPPLYSLLIERIYVKLQNKYLFFFHRSGRWSSPEWGWRGWAGQRWYAECFSWELSSLKNNKYNHLFYRYYIPGEFFSLPHFSIWLFKW